MLLLVGLVALPGCFNGVLIKPMKCCGPVCETTIYDPHCRLCRHKVAIIDVDGLIMNAAKDGLFGDGENPVSVFREKLDEAAADKRVKAVVLRLNSPGGGVTASDIMLQDLLNFRKHTCKPVVACMMDVAASGAYYLAMGCDHVYAHPTTVTGSIGVIMSLYNASELFNKVGIVSNPIKSGPNKDLCNPARPMTDEERAILQGMVDRYYNDFVKVVAWGRDMPEDDVRKLADGRVYTGSEAHELGLVDDVGYLEDAILCAMQLACIKDARIIAYDRCQGHRGSCYAAIPKIPSEIKVRLDLPKVLGHGSTFLYLWEPGLPQ
ncbi:MAG: signal peptide peptidase SppA [Gemmataceae bacterium]